MSNTNRHILAAEFAKIILANDVNLHPQEIARDAYALADAMEKESHKPHD